jgi:hypothetical protein
MAYSEKKYLLFQYKSTNTDVNWLGTGRARLRSSGYIRGPRQSFRSIPERSDRFPQCWPFSSRLCAHRLRKDPHRGICYLSCLISRETGILHHSLKGII